MIPKKYTRYVFSTLMAFFMSCFMSFVITLFNVGLVDGVIAIWLQAWLFAFCVAVPTIFLVSPLVNRMVNVIVK